MMSLVIWHNPRCSKSRQTLAILEEKGLSPEVRLYLEDAPSVDEIKTALTQLGKAPREIMRTGEADYKEQGLKDVEDDTALVEAMHNTPKLIERPIVFKDDQARVGRPPESVLEIL
ncbi:arsenate reductase (glutaredoxin) [Kordiimonas laminariae]|uniref:arsenate reductase (glutaredoxin) n=1 Tax=Kordiimonas laminariae TaxID=2917717 RepID=UPI003CCFE536